MYDRGEMSYPQVPFEGCYWVVPGRLLAGYYLGDLDTAQVQKKLRGLLNAGIRHVVNLMEETETNRDGEPFAGYHEELRFRAAQMGVEVVFVRKPIRDLGIPSRQEMAGILDEIDGAIAAGRPVYVHCWGGKGRTGTVVGCYLARHAFATGKTVLDMIRELRANVSPADHESPETMDQREMVCSWEIGE